MKYIVEADEHVQMISLIAVREGTAIMITGNVETFQTADKAIDEAYQKGFEAGQHEATTLEYQQGLDDAWEAAKKICTNWMISDQTLAEIFGQCKDIDTIMHENTAQEAINKLKAYEEQQKSDEIKVGDEVEAYSGRAIVFGTFTDTKGNKFCRYWYPSDDSFNKDKTENLKKTGRHFPQVVELIKAMKEGSE